MRLTKSHLFALQLAVTAVVLYLLVRACDWETFIELWATAKTTSWLTAFVLLGLRFVLAWLSLSLLVLPRVLSARWFQLLVEYAVIQTVAIFTPGRSAELLLIRAMKNDSVASGQVLAALIIRRLVTVATALFLALVLGSLWLAPMAAFALLGTATLGPVLLLLVISHGRLRQGIGQSLSHLLGIHISGFHDAWISLWTQNRLRLMVHTSIVVLQHLTVAAAGYAALKSLGVAISFQQWLSISLLVGLLQTLPVSIWGLGVSEGAVAVAFHQINIGPEYAVSMSLICRGLNLVNMIAWATLFYYTRLRSYFFDNDISREKTMSTV